MSNMNAGTTAETAPSVSNTARRDTPGVPAALVSREFPLYLRGFSAIDAYLGRNGGSAVYMLSGADTAELAKLFENLRYPGAAIADAALDSGDETYYFHCANLEAGGAFPREDCRPSFKLLEWYQDCGKLRPGPRLPGAQRSARSPGDPGFQREAVKKPYPGTQEGD